MAINPRSMRASELRRKGSTPEGQILSFLSGDDEVRYTIRWEHMPELLARLQGDASVAGFISGSNRDQLIVRVKAFSMTAAAALVAGLVDMQ